MDPVTSEIIASDLTSEHVGDEMALPNLVSKIEAKVDRFQADRAYDGQGVLNA